MLKLLANQMLHMLLSSQIIEAILSTCFINYLPPRIANKHWHWGLILAAAVFALYMYIVHDKQRGRLVLDAYTLHNVHELRM